MAITLEVARRIVARPLDRRLVIALFDAEEPPYFQSAYMGSHVFVRDQLRSEVDCALIMDLVGHAIAIPRLGDAVGVMGCESHPRLADVVSRAAGAHLPVATLPNDYMPDMSDHSAFGRAGNPFLFLTWGQWQHYHAPTDVPDVLDYGKMVKIADLVEALLRDLGGGPNLGGAEPHDTSRLDHARLVDLLGEPALKEMGVRGPADVHLALRRLVTAVRWG